jgi:hypothetical protein
MASSARSNARWREYIVSKCQAMSGNVRERGFAVAARIKLENRSAAIGNLQLQSAAAWKHFKGF